MDSDYAPDRQEDSGRLVSLVSALLWLLETRAVSALYKSDDEDQASYIINSSFAEPLHRAAAERLSEAWRQVRSEGGTLTDAVRSLDDYEAWWFRVQLPSRIAELSETERQAREAVAQLWEDLRHG